MKFDDIKIEYLQGLYVLNLHHEINCRGLIIRHRPGRHRPIPHRPVHMWSLVVARQVVMYGYCLLLYALTPSECHYN